MCTSDEATARGARISHSECSGARTQGKGEGGTPWTHKLTVVLAVCGAPSTDFHLGHIVVELRRSPASVTSASPSPRRRADETLPQHSARSEFEGRHQAERVLNSEVPCVRYLIGRIMKTYDYINRVVLTLPLSVYEGTWTHSPLSFLCITMILHVRR